MRMMHCTKFISTLAVVMASATCQASDFNLPALEQLALTQSKLALAAREQLQGARFAAETARAFPNPELEYLSGQQRTRNGTGIPGDARTMALTQPLDVPWRRLPRVAAADAALDVAKAVRAQAQADLLAQVRLRYYQVLRRDAELKNAKEDALTVEGVRERIARRVELGEAPRFELIKADAELLNAQKNVQAATFRVEQARSQLRQLIGQALPADFVVRGQLREVPAVPQLPALSQDVQRYSPELRRSQAEMQRAERVLAQEKALRYPGLALKASVDEDPETRVSRAGLVLTIPLWDRRSGPIGEAGAQVARARTEYEAQQFSLEQALHIAYQQYEIAQTQVAALESGIVRQAEAAVRIATAAYRFGERGFLEVLDAQRVYRAARAELIQARHELALAWIEIERLRALPEGSEE